MASGVNVARSINVASAADVFDVVDVVGIVAVFDKCMGGACTSFLCLVLVPLLLRESY